MWPLLCFVYGSKIVVIKLVPFPPVNETTRPTRRAANIIRYSLFSRIILNVTICTIDESQHIIKQIV